MTKNDPRRTNENLQTEKELEASVQHDIAILREHWAELGYTADYDDNDDLPVRVEHIGNISTSSERRQNTNANRNVRSSSGN